MTEYVEDIPLGTANPAVARLHSIIKRQAIAFQAATSPITKGLNSKPPREVAYGKAKTPAPMHTLYTNSNDTYNEKIEDIPLQD